MVLEAAINGRADALVTYNVADFGPRSGLGFLCCVRATCFGNFPDFRPFPEWLLEETRGRQIVTLALRVWRAWRDRRVFCWKILLDFELEALISSGKSTVPSRVNPAAYANAASISGFASAA
jgi:hypothetical protein